MVRSYNDLADDQGGTREEEELLVLEDHDVVSILSTFPSKRTLRIAGSLSIEDYDLQRRGLYLVRTVPSGWKQEISFMWMFRLRDGSEFVRRCMVRVLMLGG